MVALIVGTATTELRLQAIAGQLDDAERQRLIDATEFGGQRWDWAADVYEQLEARGLVTKMIDADVFGVPLPFAVSTPHGDRVVEILQERIATIAVWARALCDEISKSQARLLRDCCLWKPRRPTTPRGVVVGGFRLRIATELVELGVLAWVGDVDPKQVLPTELGRAIDQERQQ